MSHIYIKSLNTDLTTNWIEVPYFEEYDDLYNRYMDLVNMIESKKI